MKPSQRRILIAAFASSAIGVATAAPPASTEAPAKAAEPHARSATHAATRPGAPAKAGAPDKTSPTEKRAAGAHPTKSDFIALGTTTVTGNKELPKVMYIVPWKKSDLGDLGGKPVNSLLDEVLAPVDRDVFRREVSYYQALSSAPPQNGAPAAGSGPQGEK